MDSTIAEIRQIVASRLGQDVAAVTDEANFIDDLGADSLNVIEIAMDVEEFLKVELDDDVVEHMKTVGDLVRWVEGQAAR